jgi:hypothetical protein
MLTVSLLAGALSVVTAGPALADSNATTGIAITNVTPSLSDAGGLDVTGLCVPDWGGVTVQWQSWIQAIGDRDSSTVACDENGLFATRLALGPQENNQFIPFDEIQVTQPDHPASDQEPCSQFNYAMDGSSPGSLAFTSQPLSGYASPTSSIGPLTVELLDQNGVPTTTPTPLDVDVASTSAGGHFSNSPGGPDESAGPGNVHSVVPSEESSIYYFYGDGQTGNHQLVACTPDSGSVPSYEPALSNVLITPPNPAVFGLPSSGVAGSSFGEFATGYAAGEMVNLYLNSTFEGACIADATGSCHVPATVPSGPGGPSLLEGVGTLSGYDATGTFTIDPVLTLAETSSHSLNSLSHGTVSGFEAGEIVRVSEYFGDQKEQSVVNGSCLADDTGSCTVVFGARSKSSDQSGAITMQAIGDDSGLRATAEFDVIPQLQFISASGAAGTTLEGLVVAAVPGDDVAITFNGQPFTDCVVPQRGNCSFSQPVPQVAPGNYDVIATDPGTGFSDTETFTVTAGLALSTSSGPVGTDFAAEAQSFAPGELVQFTYDGAPSLECAADDLGDCLIYFQAQGAAGDHTIGATGLTSGETASATFTVSATSVLAVPSSGPAGTSFEAQASGFGVSDLVSVSVDGVAQGTCVADPTGSCSVASTSPSAPSGTYDVTATGAPSGLTATSSFTVTPSVAIDPAHGSVRIGPKVTASGFDAFSTVNLDMDGFANGTCYTDATGACQAYVFVPELANGAYVQTASESSSPLSATTTYTVDGSVFVSPSSATAGTPIHAVAQGFNGGEVVDFSYAGTPLGGCETGPDGSCILNFPLPFSPYGPATVTATGESTGVVATTALSTKAVIGPLTDDGPIGSTFSVQAQGFAADETVDIAMSNLSVGASSVVGSCVADSLGDCTADATVASLPGGTNTLSATGESSAATASTFFVVTPSMQMPSVISSGFGFRVLSTGLIPGSRVFFFVDGVNVAYCDVENPNGTCLNSFNYVGVNGPHIMSLAYAGQPYAVSVAFSMSSDLILFPHTGLDGDQIYAEVAGFGANETVDIDFGATLVATCVTDATGTCPELVPFTVPAGGPGGDYPMTATGQSSGVVATADFIKSGALALKTSTGPPGTMVEADVAGFASGETVNFQFDSSAAGSCTADAVGACTIQFAVPAESANSYSVTATGATSSLSATATFSITGKVSVSPMAGVPGSAFHANVMGFAAGETVDVSLGATHVGSCTADALGDCSAAATVPATAPGGATGVQATGETSALAASTSFQVTGLVTLAPATGAVGSGFNAQVSGFGALESVQFAFSGTSFGTCATDVNGACVAHLVVPAGSTGGMHTVGATGLTSALTATAPFKVAPTVSVLAPSAGPLAGGTVVTITGTGFVGGATVKFGATAASSVTFLSSTSLKATSPAGSGAQDVRVTTSVGTSAMSSADKFTYLAKPTVSSIAPTSGPLAGGTVVTITGTGFVSGATVKFGAAAGTSVSFLSPTSLKATSPASSGIVDVTVTTPGGTSATSAADKFTYLAKPTVSSIAPTSGPLAGGTVVTITGTGFVAGSTVKFGATAASLVTFMSSTSLKATSPAGTSVRDVVVTTPGGSSATSAADKFTYLAKPTVTAISPHSGTHLGGTTVTITGTGFVTGATVKFGSSSGTSVNVVSTTQIKVKAPAGTGSVHITVTTPGGTSTTSTADKFNYT